MAAPAQELTKRRYTVDDLFAMPDDGMRYEVLGGDLAVSPWANVPHQHVAQQLQRIFLAAVPRSRWVFTDTALRLPDGDGPVPDVVVVSVDPMTCDPAFPAEHVQTVVEVVSPSNAKNDRVTKPALYARAGIPCYWRVETRRFRGYRGPLPLIVVQLNGGPKPRVIEAAAGQASELPLAVGRPGTHEEQFVTVKLDPADLVALAKGGPR